MPENQFYPLKFEPVLKDYIWGGRNLAQLLKRPLPPTNIAESWEIAGHEDGTTVVKNGRFAGIPLTDLQQQFGLELIGTNNQWAEVRGKFPLLIKILDASQPLSVQVHPDDAYALAHEGNELGKTEMWVVLHATPDAGVILGVRPGTTPSAFRHALTEGRLEPFLHHIPVKTGDIVCVPAGSMHAILGGLLIAEIQQNSNITYRVYDWNRLQAGKPRPLHIDKAMDVINFDQVAPQLLSPIVVAESGGIRRLQLCQNRYFVTEQVEMAAGSLFNGRCNGSTLEIWGAIEGAVSINGEQVTAVEFTLLPAALGDFSVIAAKGATLLRTYVP